jgi:hypothetical protein
MCIYMLSCSSRFHVGPYPHTLHILIFYHPQDKGHTFHRTVTSHYYVERVGSISTVEKCGELASEKRECMNPSSKLELGMNQFYT